MTTHWSERAFAYFILAVIFGAFFLLALFQGIKIHWEGYLDVAFVLYIIAVILAGMAKVCAWEIRMDLCKTPQKKRRR